MQTPEGAIKARQTMISKYGENYFKEIGLIGGKAKNPLKGFGTNRDLARVSGARGGRISRRKAK